MPDNNEIWVFLSHSNKDYEKVIEVRNLLEQNHFRPLMFFLKCLDDDDEIDDLIKREIDCRGRFILCDSINARESGWVKKEIDYIKSKNRIYQTIDLDDPTDVIQKQIENFRKQNSIFVSFNPNSAKDTILAEKLKTSLKEKNFAVNMSKRFTREDDLEDLKQYHAVTFDIVEHETLLIILSDDWGYHELQDIFSPFIRSIHDSQSKVYLCVTTDGWDDVINAIFKPLIANKKGRIFNFTKQDDYDNTIMNIVNVIYNDIASSSK